MSTNDMANSGYFVLLAYLAVGIPLNFYLYHDVIDKRWRSIKKIRNYSIAYGILAAVCLLALLFYTYLQFKSSDYKEGGASVLSCALAVYGLYLHRRQTLIFRFCDILRTRANHISTLYKTGDQHTSTSKLLFSEKYERGPVKDEIASTMLDDNYPGDGPRVTFMTWTCKPMVEDWTEIMVRIGLWIRLSVIPARMLFGTALRPKKILSDKADVSDAWTLSVVKHRFLAPGGTSRIWEPRPLDTLTECVVGARDTLATWRETLRLVPESEWSQALSEFRSDWIEGLDVKEAAWEVYLTFALHCDSQMLESVPMKRYCPGYCCSKGRRVTPTPYDLESGNVAIPSCGIEPVPDLTKIENLVRNTMKGDNDDDINIIVTPSILMTALMEGCLAEKKIAWFKSICQLGRKWDSLAALMVEDRPELIDKDRVIPEELTLGVDVVIALAVLLGADQKQFEYPLESTDKELKGVLQERREHVLSTLQESQAKTVLMSALRYRLKITGRQSLDVAESRYCLGKVLQAQNDFEGALKEYDGAISIWKNALSSKRALALSKKAEVLGHQNDFDKGTELSKAATEAWKKAGHETPQLELAAMVDIEARLLEKQMKYSAATGLYEESLSIRECYFGENHRAVANARDNLGRLKQLQGNYSGAENDFSKSLKIVRSNPGGDHEYLIWSLTNMAALFTEQDKYEEARETYDEAREKIREVFGRNHPQVAAILVKLADFEKELGNFDIAEIWYRRVLDIDTETLGENDLEVARDLRNLAKVLQKQGNYDVAQTSYQDALKICEERLGKDHPEVASYLNNLAGLLREKGQYIDAKPLYESALEIREKKLGSEHPDVAISLNNLAMLLQSQGNFVSAKPLYERALDIRKTKLGADHPDVAKSQNNLAELLRNMGDYDTAEKHLRDAIATYVKAHGPDHGKIATCRSNLAGLLNAKGQHDEAKKLYKQAIEIRKRVQGPDHPDVAIDLTNLAALLESQINGGQGDQARHFVGAVLLFLCVYDLDNLEQTRGPDHLS